MTRNEAKKKIEKLQVQILKLQTFLNESCKHRNVKNEEDPNTVGDYFRHYQDICMDCDKVLRRT